MSAPRPPGALLALTPGEARDAAGAARLLDVLREAFAAGLPAALLREPELPDAAFLELARAARRLADDAGGRWVGVHDRLHVALAAGADAVHLGFRSLPPAEAARIAAGRLAVGFSAHAHDAAGVRVGADYLTFGPVLETPSKRGLLEPVGFEALREVARGAGVPVLGLGGLLPAHALAARAAGAGMAVLGGLLGSVDPAASTRAYLEALAAAEVGA